MRRSCLFTFLFLFRVNIFVIKNIYSHIVIIYFDGNIKICSERVKFESEIHFDGNIRICRERVKFESEILKVGRINENIILDGMKEKIHKEDYY